MTINDTAIKGLSQINLGYYKETQTFIKSLNKGFLFDFILKSGLRLNELGSSEK